MSIDQSDFITNKDGFSVELGRTPKPVTKTFTSVLAASSSGLREPMA